MAKVFLKSVGNRWGQIIVAAFIGIMYLPARGIKFSWIDDGYIYYASRVLIEDTVNGRFGKVWVFLTDNGERFRPVWWLWQSINYLLSGYNPATHYFWHFVMIVIIAMMLYKIIKDFCKSNAAALFGTLLLLVNPLNIENWYRLAPQEPLICLLILTSFLVWQKSGRPLLGGIILSIGVLAKEPVFAVLSPFYIIYIWKFLRVGKREKDIEKYVLPATLIFMLILLPRIAQPITSYSEYNLNLSAVVNNFVEYLKLLRRGFSPYLEIGLSVFVFNLLRYWILKRKDTCYINLSVLCVFTATFYIIVISPWRTVAYRYLLPSTVPLVFFLSLQAVSIVGILDKRIVAICVGIFLVQQIYNLVTAYNWGVSVANSTQLIQKTYKEIAETAKPGSYLLLNTPPALELSFETGFQLAHYYSRPDIKVDFLDMKKLPRGQVIVVSTSLADQIFEDNQLMTSFKDLNVSEVVVESERLEVLPPRLVVYELYKRGVNMIGSYRYSTDSIVRLDRFGNNWKLFEGSM